MNKKYFVFGLFGLLLVMFAAGVVSAADFGSSIGDPIKDWATKWVAGEDISPTVVKVLFWALVSMVVFSISDKLPFGLKGKTTLKTFFSIIVGFLAMAYITPEEVYAIMVSYSAMGFVLSGAIPFIVLATFTFSLASSGTKGSKQKLVNQVISWVMWAFFFGFMIYKTILGLGEDINFMNWVIVGLVVLVLAMHGAIFAYIRKMERKAELEAAKEVTSKAVEHEKMEAGALESKAK